MTNKEYTNEDIISSLEVIATTCNCNECKIRSGKWGTCNCSETTANAALDLINHQKAEIDVLRADLKRVCAERDARICTNNFIKSEAVKEFADEFERRCIKGGIYPAFVKRQLENVKKEMVGENNRRDKND